MLTRIMSSFCTRAPFSRCRRRRLSAGSHLDRSNRPWRDRRRGHRRASPRSLSVREVPRGARGCPQLGQARSGQWLGVLIGSCRRTNRPVRLGHRPRSAAEPRPAGRPGRSPEVASARAKHLARPWNRFSPNPHAFDERNDQWLPSGRGSCPDRAGEPRTQRWPRNAGLSRFWCADPTASDFSSELTSVHRRRLSGRDPSRWGLGRRMDPAHADTRDPAGKLKAPPSDARRGGPHGPVPDHGDGRHRRLCR